MADTRKNPSNSAAEAGDAPDKKATAQSTRAKKSSTTRRGSTATKKATTAATKSSTAAKKSSTASKRTTAAAKKASTATKPAAKKTSTAANSTKPKAEAAATKSASKTTAKPAAKKTTTRRVKSTKKASGEVTEPTVAQVAAGEVHISKADKDGDHIVMTVGGKRRSLDDVDESTFNEQEEAKDEKELVEEEGFALSDSDDADEPEQQVVSAGATADPVKDYLKQIGKVALLNAVEEVELAKRIEAGLFAEEALGDEDNPVKADDVEDYIWIQEDGRNAKNHLLEANLRLVVSLAKRYTGRGMLFLDLIQEGNLGLIRAVEKFDYTKGYKFSTYATWWIKPVSYTHLTLPTN